MFGMKKSLVRSLGVVALVGASLAGGSEPAQAFDRGTCESVLGSGNVSRYHLDSIDTGTAGKVDFGDHMHLGGVPHGTAAICFSGNGRAAVIGRVFADSSTKITVEARVTFFTASGTASTTTTHRVEGKDAASTLVNRVSPTGSWPTARVRLFRGTSLIQQEVYTSG